MKKAVLACFSLLTIGTVHAQNFGDMNGVDARALTIPPAETASTTTIAGYINKHFPTDPEKIRAIYTWVTANIRYNTDSMYAINWGADEEVKVTAALRRRKGVCENYAAIFTDIAQKAGLTAYSVTGYTRQYSTVVRTGHVWCAVRLNKEWFFCDPTWDEGFRNTPRYFMISPAEFIQTHFPFDPLWQLLPSTVTERDFTAGLTGSKAAGIQDHADDSALAYLALPEAEKNEAAAYRMQQAGIKNELQKHWLAFTKMKIAIVNGENDMELYNSAVADLNKATNFYNAFVQYRNNHFIPLKAEAEINGMLRPIAIHISAAWEKVKVIGKKADNFQYDTGGLSERLVRLTGQAQRQKDFLKRYFAVSPAERDKLFYRSSGQ